MTSPWQFMQRSWVKTGIISWKYASGSLGAGA
jgi:hypothetical protein